MATDYNMGRAKGTITTEYDGSGVNDAKRGFKDLQRESKSTRDGLGEVGTASGTASLAIAAGLVYAANKAIDFQKQISAIGAVSGATNDELESLRQKALQLGADTSFSASEAAQAMEELAKAGISVKDILNGAADAAVALAAAGGIELAEAAEIAANAMGQFNLKASDLGEVVDYIAGAANASAISVTDFNESMKQAGAVANLAGLSFEDLATAIALMGQNGIKGSDAGTSLKTMLANLQPTTAKTNALFRELGLITKDGSNAFFDARGNIKSLADISGLLNTALKDQTAQQKSLTLQTLFGSDAIRAAAILTKSGAEGFNKMNAAINATKASDVAAARLDNVAGSIEQMKGAAETAAITIGTLFLPYIRKVTDFITKLTNKFNGLDPKWQKLIGFALAGAAALLGVIAAVSGVGFAVIGIGAAFATLKIAAIVTLIVAGIAAIIAAIVLLYKRSEAFRNAIGTIFAVISEHFRAMIKVIQPFINFVRNVLIPAIRDGLRKAVENMRPAFEAISSFFRDKVAPALAEFRAAIVAATPTILRIGKAIAEKLGTALATIGKILGVVIPILLKVAGVVFPMLAKVISFLIRNIPTFVNIIQKVISVLKTIGLVIAVAVIGPIYALYKAVVFVFNAIKSAVVFLYDLWKKVFGFFAPLALAAFDKIKQGLMTALGIFKNIIGFFAPIVQAAFGLIKTIISTVMSVIRAIIAVAWTIIKTIFQAAVNAIMAVVRPAFELIKTIITNVMNFLKPIISAAWAFITNAFKVATEFVVGLVKSAWDAIVAAFNAAVNFLRPIIEGFVNFFKSLWSTVTTFVSGVISAFWEKVKALFAAAVARVVAIIDGIKAIVAKIKAFFDQLRAAAEGGTGTLIAFVKGIPGKILDALGNVGRMLYDAGKKIIQGLIDGISGMIGKLKDKLSGITDLIPDWKGPMSVDIKLLRPSGKAIMEGLIKGINEITPELRATLQGITLMAATLPTPTGEALREQLFSSASPTGAAGSVAVRARDAQPITIENINITGVWDMTDPLASRKIAKDVKDAIDKYTKDYR